MADNRRTSTRHAVSITAKLIVDGTPRECTVMNLSLGGALLTAGEKMPMDARVQIIFSVPTVEEPIDIGCTVRWSDDQALGLQFDGLRARDVWALNKYFEDISA